MAVAKLDAFIFCDWLILPVSVPAGRAPIPGVNTRLGSFLLRTFFGFDFHDCHPSSSRCFDRS
ncbi:hypothetical protein RBSWK_03919 [Rhodopirellula baltica SWK14]|uniref:Uncharacterized protein n=1 Tax=Rhodopirellula baltica SWK14 TaxID=993516 RepID=L7CED9_RHOBT|nr:hypothetical protein RBSWK_03919 [Rhodopirellula baltica SWK14]